MPANLNKVFLMGNLTRDPEMRTLPSGTTVCAFGVAVNRQFVNAAGVTQEEVCFIDVSAFGRSGEVVAQYLRKGSPIFVEGRLHFEQWDERETGSKRCMLAATRSPLNANPIAAASAATRASRCASPAWSMNR